MTVVVLLVPLGVNLLAIMTGLLLVMIILVRVVGGFAVMVKLVVVKKVLYWDSAGYYITMVHTYGCSISIASGDSSDGNGSCSCT